MTTKTAALWAFALGSISRALPRRADPAVAAHRRGDAEAG